MDITDTWNSILVETDSYIRSTVKEEIVFELANFMAMVQKDIGSLQASNTSTNARIDGLETKLNIHD